MRARLIANPASGADRAAQLLPVINARLREVVDDLDITLTTTADDAGRAGARAAAEGCDAVYVAGGDGTINAVVRGLVDAGAARTPAVGVIPLGTGNDFAKALGLGEAPDAALDALVQLRVADLDLGTVNGVPFVNASAGGFVADVSEAVTSGLKDATGKLAYLIGGARALFGSQSFSARIANLSPEAAGTPPDSFGPREIQLFAVCNARFIGGGYPIAPEALADDGLLDVLIVPGMPMLEFVAVLQQIGNGDSRQRPDLLHFRASAFDLEIDRPVRVNTDGEVMETDRCRYRVRPRALSFFCGPQPQALTPVRSFVP